jgi:hypothetical protein
MDNQTNRAIFEQQHKQWLDLPVTKSLLLALDRHEDFISSTLASRAMDKETTSEMIRLIAAQLGTTKTIKKLVYDTETFTAKCSPK